MKPSSVLIDWTSTHKRPLEANTVHVQSLVDDPNSKEEAPFSFVKKARKCKLECCSPLWALASSEGGHETLDLSEVAVVFIPPPCEVSWFSGICTSTQYQRDPFMDETHEDISGSSRTNIGLLGHELEIDDCLKCADGGYQSFRVAVTDQSGKRKGSVRVERTGGDFLELESEHLTFSTTQSISQAAVVPLVLKYFPSVAKKLSVQGESIDTLQDCTICIGVLTLRSLPVRPM